MDELFAPPGTPWQRVSPRLVSQRRLILVVLWVLMTGALVGASIAVMQRTLALWIVVVSLVGLAWCLRLVGRSARSWRYAERDDDLYIAHGILFRAMVAVPYGRMQFVDVQSGPIDRMFGIATVRLHTAAPGTSAVIPGLPADEAARLRDKLTMLGEAQAAGL